MCRELHKLMSPRAAELLTGRVMTVVPVQPGWMFVQQQERGRRPLSSKTLQTLEQRERRHLRAPRAWAVRAS
jgi:hypothetical protein